MRPVALLLALTSSVIVTSWAAEVPGREWKKMSPGSQGIDSLRLHQAIAGFERHLGTTGFSQSLIVRGGVIVWEGSDSRNRHNVWSVTKSFTSSVLGLLIDDGKCRLDDPVAKFLPAVNSRWPEYGKVTFRHFASMTSGYDGGGDQGALPFEPTKPLFAPGSRFRYWDSAMNQFANVLTRVAGEPIEELFRRRIANQIGMDPDNWDWGDWGEVDGLTVNGGAGNKSKGIHINARELARFGLLFLRGGRWDGRQLIGQDWVRLAISPQDPTTNSSAGGPGFRRGNYGFNWWLNGVGPDSKHRWPAAPAGAFAAMGFNNNVCMVVPEWDIVITRLSLKGIEEDFSEPRWNEFFTALGAVLK